jgi:hypothetical protein
MVGLTGSRRKYAIAGMQRHCVGGVAFWPPLLGDGNWAVAESGNDPIVIIFWMRSDEIGRRTPRKFHRRAIPQTVHM